MTGNLEKVLTSERFQNAASVLPILIGLIPRQNDTYFKLRESIIVNLKKRAVLIYETGKHRRGDSIMVVAQEQNKRLDEDKDFVENYEARVKFTQSPLRKKYRQIELPLPGLKEKVKRRVLESDEEKAFRLKMERAETEIWKRSEKYDKNK